MIKPETYVVDSISPPIRFYNQIHINQTQHYKCHCSNCESNCVYSPAHTSHQRKLQSNHLQRSNKNFVDGDKYKSKYVNTILSQI